MYNFVNEVLLETLIEKLDSHEKKINRQEKDIKEVKEMIMTQPGPEELFDRINTLLNELHSEVKKLVFRRKNCVN